MTRLAAAACLGAGVLLVVAGWSAGPATAQVTVDLRHSRFAPGELVVPAGTTVRFTIRNLDPIDHEFLLGDQEVQDAHERGTEASHGDRPGEVSVAAGETATTAYSFDEAGVVYIGCHLPRHWDYGMQGRVVVVA